MRARDALYGKYNMLFSYLSKKRNIGSYCNELDQFKWLCVWLTTLDGFSAYKRIVLQIGEFFILKKNTNAFFMDWFNDNAKSKFGKKRVNSYLQNNAEKYESVAAFLKEVQQFERCTSRSSCRAHLVKSMYKRKILPIEILEECLYDSHEDIRNFAVRKLNVLIKVDG